jgi:methyl-accepting chemotaxis protein
MDRLESYAAKDRFFAVFLVGHLGLALALTAWFRQPWALSLLIGLTATLVPSGTVLLWPGTRLSRYTCAIAATAFTALFIHLSGGAIEAHFHIFGVLCWLALYHDWDILVVSAAAVAVHHLTGNYLFPQSVFHYGSNLIMVVVHAAGLIFATVGICWQAIESRRLVAAAELARGASEQAAQAQRLQELLASMRQIGTQVTHASQELTGAAGSTGGGAQEISRTIAGLSQSFQAQADRLNGSLDGIQSLRRQAADLARHIANSKSKADESR